VYERLHVSAGDGGRVVTLAFDHGKANEIGSAELRDLERLARELRQGPAAVLVTVSHKRSGKGKPIFVSGANVGERAGWDDLKVKAHVRWQREVLRAIASAPVFHVAVVDGVALGWGTEYTLTADYVLAGDAATFGLPETGLGILPGAGGTSDLWARIGPAHVLRLGMTGERISADEAVRIGLAHERVKDGAAGLARAMALAALAATRSPTANAAFKRAVHASVGSDPVRRAEIEAAAYEVCVDRGEAAIGRASFDTVRAGGVPAWGPRRLED
jgi:enoyl-CoA hydratase/carnithine racemase